MKKRLFKIKTFGCKVNQYETQAIREKLLSGGYEEVGTEKKADLCIVNTCTVTQKADKDSRETLRQYIRENPESEIVAAGCYVEADSETLKAIDHRIRAVSNKEKMQIAEIIKGEDCCDSLRPSSNDNNSSISSFKGYTKAFVKVQDGCNNFCSYCKVPYVRGRSRSRNPKEIIKESAQLIENGYKELILTGICLGDFGKDLDEGITLAWLIQKITAVDKDFRIRLSSIELPDVTDSLIDLIVSSDKVCNHIHIPLQSGDDDILKKMNRKYTSSEFVDRIGYIRSKISGIAITTDLIVGFPTESDENFNNTLKAIHKIAPSRAHIFTYSPRRGTESFALKDDIHSSLKKERLKQLKQITDRLADEYKHSSSVRGQRLLIENTRDKATGKLTGYTDTYIKLIIDGPDKFMGEFLSL